MIETVIPTKPPGTPGINANVRLIQPAQFDQQLGIPAIAITGTVVMRSLTPRTPAEATEINKALAEAGIS